MKFSFVPERLVQLLELGNVKIKCARHVLFVDWAVALKRIRSEKALIVIHQRSTIFLLLIIEFELKEVTTADVVAEETIKIGFPSVEALSFVVSWWRLLFLYLLNTISLRVKPVF